MAKPTNLELARLMQRLGVECLPLERLEALIESDPKVRADALLNHAAAQEVLDGKRDGLVALHRGVIDLSDAGRLGLTVGGRRG